MKVSLVIPAYNEEKYIKDCLISVMAQEVRPDEIIVVDNNSTDKTMEIVRHFPVTVIKEKKQGMTPARNAGFNFAHGDIIARCDADTRLPPDWIKRIQTNFKTQKIDALSGPFEFYDLKLKTTFLFIVFDVIKPIIHNEILIGPNMIITKKVWEKVKNIVCLDDKKVHEDIDISIHISDIGGIIGRDEDLKVKVSGRRMMKNPKSFFGEYPLRFIKTLLYHKRDILSPFLIDKLS